MQLIAGMQFCVKPVVVFAPPALRQTVAVDLHRFNDQHPAGTHPVGNAAATTPREKK
jgi:hypothetical protein